MRTLVLCTTNPGKVAELKAMLPAGLELRSPPDLGVVGELPETGGTLEDNALQKARHVFHRCGLHCLADDTGLEVDALDGAPGVRSARYAGPGNDAVANMARLLHEMGAAQDRSARFRTVLALVGPDGEHLFEGQVRGSIAEQPRGRGGFGYDPIFIPEGGVHTFAEMDRAAKNATSHRGRALQRLIAFLAQWHQAR